MVDSMEQLKSSRSVAGKNFPNFEMLDAKIASALNKIIPNSHYKRKVSLEEQKSQKEDRFPRERQVAFMTYDFFRLTGAHDTVLGYADLLSVALHDDNIQEFDTRWDGQRDGVPKACPKQAAADPQGSRTCVRANTSILLVRWHMQGEKERINVLPWYRPVGVVSTSSESHKEGRPGCPQGLVDTADLGASI